MKRETNYKMVPHEGNVIALKDRVSDIGEKYLTKGRSYPIKLIIDKTGKRDNKVVFEDDQFGICSVITAVERGSVYIEGSASPKTKLERIEEVLGSDAFYYAKEDQDVSVLIDLLEEIDNILGETDA